jgi:iron complex outermembrane recepter protein
MSKLSVSSIAALLAACAASSAQAQSQLSGEALQLEEVVVTAEKRQENLQKVAISIQVKNGEDLKQAGRKRIDEIMEGTVGIQMQSSPTGSSFFVRGVAPNSAGRGDPVTVPIIVDGVAQNRTDGVRGGTLDLAQVEVMRGPQSTGLGANSLSGAISLVTNKPVFEYQGSGTVEAGNYNKSSIEGVLNVPLSANQAIRVAYSSDQRDGFNSNGSGATNVTNARLKYRFKPNDDIDIVATVAHQKISGNGVDAGVASSGKWVPYAGQSAVAFTTGCATAMSSASVIGCPPAFYWDAAGNNGQNFRQRSNAWDDGLPRDAWFAYQISKMDQANVELDWTTGIGTVVFQPSYQSSTFKSQEPPNMGASFNKEDIETDTTTADLRINGNPIDRLTWQAGAYYSYDTWADNRFTNVFMQGATVSAAYTNGALVASHPCATNQVCYTIRNTPEQTRTGWSSYANGEYSLLDTLRLIGGVRYNVDKAHVETFNALFASNPYDMFSQVDVDAATAAGALLKGSAEWKKATYRVGAEWDVTPESMLYATYSTGYTPGNYGSMNLRNFPTVPNGIPGKAVTLRQISTGYKSQWLDNQLQFNAEYFNTVYHNRVVGIPNAYTLGGTSTNCNALAPTGNSVDSSLTFNTDSTTSPTLWCATLGMGVLNAPDLKSQGIDLDMAWLISASDRLTMTAEWIDSKYTTAPVFNSGLTLTGANLVALDATQTGGMSGLTLAAANVLAAQLNDSLNALVGVQLQNAPKYSATLDYSHVFTFGNGSKLTPRVAATYKAKYWTTPENPGGTLVSQIVADSSSNNLFWQQAYTKWDAYLLWNNPDGRFAVTGYVHNIANEVVMNAYSGNSTATSPGTVNLEQPRTVGLTLSANF